MSETDLMREIRAALCSLSGVRVWRNNEGVFRQLNGEGVIRCGLGVGSADLVGVCLTDRGWPLPASSQVGRFFAIEVKAANARTSKQGKRHREEQDAWARAVRELGGFVSTVRSVDEAMAAVERCRRGESA